MSEGASLITVVANSEVDEGDPHGQIDLERWRSLAQSSLAAEGVDRGELNLVFVGAAAMAELNETHMGGTGPTDVLAFPIDGEIPSDGDVPVLLGDVVVCPQVAAGNAEERGIPADDELALLVVHGVLHVLGHDHADVDDTALMTARERALLEEHHRQ